MNLRKIIDTIRELSVLLTVELLMPKKPQIDS